MNGGASLDEAIQTAVNVGVAAEIGTETASILNTRHLEYNGTRAIVTIQDNNIVVTGYEIDADENAAAIRRAAERNPHPHVGSDEVIGRLREILSQSSAGRNGVTQEDDAAYMDAVKRGDKMRTYERWCADCGVMNGKRIRIKRNTRNDCIRAVNDWYAIKKASGDETVNFTAKQIADAKAAFRVMEEQKVFESLERIVLDYVKRRGEKANSITVKDAYERFYAKYVCDEGQTLVIRSIWYGQGGFEG